MDNKGWSEQEKAMASLIEGHAKCVADNCGRQPRMRAFVAENAWLAFWVILLLGTLAYWAVTK